MEACPDAPEKTHQALITRLPYPDERTLRYDAAPILAMAEKLDKRALVCLSAPIHAEAPLAPFRLLQDLLAGGLRLVSCVAWFRDRHIVVLRSRRLTNTWEPIFILARGDDYVFDRDAATKVKKGFEGREGSFDEDEYKTCIGDHWPIRNDRRDRRYMPAQAVLNCGNLAGLMPGDGVLDPYANPGVREACALLGWRYVDGGLPSALRGRKVADNKEPK